MGDSLRRSAKFEDLFRRLQGSAIRYNGRRDGGLGEVVCRGGLLGLGIHYGWLGIRKADCAGGGSSTAVGGGLAIQ